MITNVVSPTAFEYALPIGEVLPGEATRQRSRFMEGAYRRYAQATTEIERFFPVSKKRPLHDPAPERTHPHKVLVESLVMDGLLQHISKVSREDRRKHWFALTETGIAYVEAQWNNWHSDLSDGQAECLQKFEALVENLAVGEGKLLLPEPGRSWRNAQAFEDVTNHRRYLYVYRSQGYNIGPQWIDNDNYYYGMEPEFAFFFELDEQLRQIEWALAAF